MRMNPMTDTQHYALPDSLPAPLAAALEGWRQAKRAENDLPFADDVDLDQLGSPTLSAIVHVFYNPLRLRLDQVSAALDTRYGRPLNGRFLDEFASRSPFESSEAQCEAAIHARAPTFFIGADELGRLVLPYWGDGHVRLMVMIVADRAGTR
jgi:hypothetical protein